MAADLTLGVEKITCFLLRLNTAPPGGIANPAARGPEGLGLYVPLGEDARSLPHSRDVFIQQAASESINIPGSSNSTSPEPPPLYHTAAQSL